MFIKILFLLLFPALVSAQTIRIEAESYPLQSGTLLDNCSEGGKCVGWIDNGDFMQYNTEPGKYLMTMRIATPNTGVKIQIGTKTFSPASTGGWQIWQSISDTITLSSVTRFYSAGAGWNFNWFELTKIISTPPSPPASTGLTLEQVRSEINSAITNFAAGLPELDIKQVTGTGTVTLDTIFTSGINMAYFYLATISAVQGTSVGRCVKIIVVNQVGATQTLGSNTDLVSFVGLPNASVTVNMINNYPVIKGSCNLQTQWTITIQRISL